MRLAVAFLLVAAGCASTGDRSPLLPSYFEVHASRLDTDARGAIGQSDIPIVASGEDYALGATLGWNFLRPYDYRDSFDAISESIVGMREDFRIERLVGSPDPPEPVDHSQELRELIGITRDLLREISIMHTKIESLRHPDEATRVVDPKRNPDGLGAGMWTIIGTSIAGLITAVGVWIKSKANTGEAEGSEE